MTLYISIEEEGMGQEHVAVAECRIQEKSNFNEGVAPASCPGGRCTDGHRAHGQMPWCRGLWRTASSGDNAAALSTIINYGVDSID